MTRSITRTLVAVFALFSLALVGCSSDAADDGNLTASATEFAFTPTAWTATAGQPFTIDFTNAGVTEHEWAVITLGDDLETEEDFTEDKVLFEVEKIPAGTDTTQTFTVAEAGTYQVVCALDGHFNAGMEGVLTVE